MATTSTPEVHLSAPNSSATTLRQRKPAVSAHEALSHGEVEDVADGKEKDEDVIYGKTPSGVVFRVPQTHSFLHTILTTLHRSSLTRLTCLTLTSQPVLFYLLRNYPLLRSSFFLLYFAFWRGAYDWGFAYVLRRQSEKRWIVRTLKSWGWLDIHSKQGGEGGKEWAKWWKRELEMKMGQGYKWEDAPREFNAWLIFRQLVDLVLLNDFVAYSCFAWSNLHFPSNHSVPMHIFRWIFGWSLIFFNLWVKMDAHRVVKDYAWYWGDAFWLMVMQHDLVFDGVYEIAPHPMYSVGYAGYYGISMVVGSYAVLFTSLAAHAAQFAFLLWFENPHIERTYGGAKKPLASRVPLSWRDSREGTSSLTTPVLSGATSPNPQAAELEEATPGATEAAHHLGETETEPGLEELPSTKTINPEVRKPRSDSSYSTTSFSNGRPNLHFSKMNMTNTKRTRSISMHDLTHRFFRQPAIVLSRIDMFRSTDFALIILLFYSLSTLVPALPCRLALTAHFLHALSWRLFHSFGLGLLLRAQSKTKWLVRHYLKHYHYPGELDDDGEGDEGKEKESVVKRATEEAFGNWQVGYNISLVMTYVSFAGLAWKTYHLPMDWTVGGTILRHVLGLSLVALHIWAAISSYEVLGDFGWLYSDFFLIEQIPSQLAYTGIYRFLNNPEQNMGGAAFFGLWLISNSKLVLVLAIVSHLSHWWFLSTVERPHMKRLYGDRLRKDGGLTKTLKSVAGKTLVDKAGKHAPEIKRVVQEVRGSIEKVEDRVTEAVEDFLDHARPMFSDMVNDTKFLLQQSRERMIITRVANDISAYDQSRYSLNLPTSSSAPVPRYHVGQPIRVSWTAPSNHSRKDWIGIYRLGSCRSQLVTRISSVGKWMPIYQDEWDGDEYVEPSMMNGSGDKGGVKREHAGEVVFKGDQLPWAPGEYELRYHHDGKHNVMSRVVPVEIYVAKPIDVSSYKAIRSTLLNIVTLSLDSDPNLVPRSVKGKQGRLRGFHSNPDTSEQGQGAAKDPTLTTGIASDTTGKAAVGPDEIESDSATLDANARMHTRSVDALDLGHLSHASDQRGGNDDRGGHHGVDLKEEGVKGVGTDGEGTFDKDEDDGHNVDDFTIMDEIQAKRIVSLCEMAFGVEMTVDVVVADANVGLLASRVVGARRLAGGQVGDGAGNGG